MAKNVCNSVRNCGLQCKCKNVKISLNVKVTCVCSLQNLFNHLFDISDGLCDLVLFVQFKKREKHRWRSVNFSKVARLN